MNKKKKNKGGKNRWQWHHADDGDRVTVQLWTGNQKVVDLNPVLEDP